MEEEKKPEKDKRFKIVEEFSKEVLKKYGKYVKAIVMMGSVARQEFKSTSDIDVFVVIDDTTYDITPDMHDKIDEDLEKMADGIEEAKISIKTPDGKEEKISILSIQPSYTLTEFWDYARVAHPIIYNFIKEGVAVFDTGFFEPIKRLLEMGRIPATREAIESYMEGAPKKLMRAKTVKLLMLAEDCYYAMLNTTQAVLMFMGLAPPVPNKAYDDVTKFLVEPGILEKQYADWLKEIIEIRKKIEHKEMMDVTGTFVDEWIEKSEKYIDKMFSLLNALEIRKREKIIDRTHEVLNKAAVTALQSLKKLPPKEQDIPDAFKREFVDTRMVEAYYWDVWKKINEMKKKVDERKIADVTDKEVEDLREHVRKLIRDLARVLKNVDIGEEK